MAKSQLDKIITALAGEFFVAGQLCMRGYVPSLTLKNYPSVDIFCLNPVNNRQISIQVKTKRGGRSYYVPENIDGLDVPFVFVYINKEDNIEYYIVPSKDVAKISARERDDYISSRPHVRKSQPRMISLKSIELYKDRWDLLSLDD